LNYSKVRDLTQTPIRTKTGSIGCPRCETILKIKKASFLLDEEYVGHFESLVCPICNYSILTENGYESAIEEAKKFGLVGSAEVKEVDDLIEEQLIIPNHQKGNNLEYGKLVTELEEKLFETYNMSPQIIIPPIRYPRSLKMKIIQRSN